MQYSSKIPNIPKYSKKDTSLNFIVKKSYKLENQAATVKSKMAPNYHSF